jgi:RIO-like serine/threonine protein kinase
MRLDLTSLRYLTTDDFRVLTAIEMGMRNHEIVPVSLIESIAKLKRGNTHKVIQNLLKHKLIQHTSLIYDGYSLNFIGYDFLAIHALMRRGVLMKIGPKLGVGKESDVYICYVNPNAGVDTELTEQEMAKLRQEMFMEDHVQEDDNKEEEHEEGEKEEEEKEYPEEEEKYNEENANINLNEINIRFEHELIISDTKCQIAVIKLARLGRICFRAVKLKRDYVKTKSHYNWLYLSRLSATNEFKFLKGLYIAGFPVPKPYDHNRHAILMQYIPSYPLCRVEELGDKEKAYNELISLMVKISERGLIHGDFNEFNILVDENQKMYIIDFPQMISLEHDDAKFYFERDVKCIGKFFMKKFGMSFENEMKFSDLVRKDYLDVKLKAYGNEIVLARLKKEEKDEKDLHKYLDEIDIEDEEKINEEDLEFNKEDIEVEIKDKTEKKIDIKTQVKKMIERQNISTKSSNRFKGKKKEKVKI